MPSLEKMAGKEAIAFVIDASASMASPYPSSASGTAAAAANDDADDPIPLSVQSSSQPQSQSQDSSAGDGIDATDSQLSAIGAEAEAALFGSSDSQSPLPPRGPREGRNGDDDENDSHNTNNNDNADTNTAARTRLEAAKEACLSMISNLILQSKTNECSVLVCKASQTNHHLCAPEQVEAGTAPFKNIWELCEMSKPTVGLLREIKSIQPTVKPEPGLLPDVVGSSSSGIGGKGDLCDGIIVASDAMFRKTDKRKYRRRLIVFTDAQHEVNVDESQLLMVVEGLKKMQCSLTVIGLDFVNSAEFDKPATEEDADDDEEDQMEEDADDDDGSTKDGNGSGSDDDSDGDDDESMSEEDRNAQIKDENEKLLISLAKLTGGKVIAASTLQQVLESTCGKRIPRSSRRNAEFTIAPGLSVPIKFSLLLKKGTVPRLSTEAVLVDMMSGNPKKNALDEEMMTGIDRITTHWDADNPDLEVPKDKQTKAYKYGADLIPIGDFDLQALKLIAPTSITILGYMPAKEIPRIHFHGEPYAISGGDSRRACVAISALAQALYKEKNAALCKFVKNNNSDPLLAALFPLDEDDADDKGQGRGNNDSDGDDDDSDGDDDDSEGKVPRRLFLVQLPFAKDINMLSMASLDDSICSDADATVCDNLIDALMLPDDCLRTENIGNPAIRSFNKTLIERAINPSAPLSFTRQKGPEDPMSTPHDIVENASGAIDAFLKAFPTRPEEVSQKGNTKSTGAKPFLSHAY